MRLWAFLSSLHRLAAQTLCVGFDGTRAVDTPLDALRELGITSVVLFARNCIDAAQTRDLCATLRDALGDELPPTIAIDQEGGRVARIRDGIVQMPAMMALGATHDAELAFRGGRCVGADLQALGITLNFAPVLDLALDPANAVIGARSLGDDPPEVARMGLAFARGLRAGGVRSVAKHFPGHGATSIDSHLDMPTITVIETILRARDLAPFAAAVREPAVDALMTAHVVVQALDPLRPATMSALVVDRIVRHEWHFDGAVFTDDLEMGAIANGTDIAAIAVGALAAGCDGLTIAHDLDRARIAIEAIVRAVEDGTLPLDRVQSAAERMHRLRMPLEPESGSVDATAANRIARAAVTVLRGDIRIASAAAVSVISFEGATTEGAQGAHAAHPSLSAALRGLGYKSEHMRVPLEPSDDDLALLEMVLRGQPGRATVIVMRRAHLFARQAAAVARLLDVAPDALLVSAREPFDVPLFPGARRVVCIYSDESVSIDALAEAIAGRFTPTGRLPIHLEASAATARR